MHVADGIVRTAVDQRESDQLKQKAAKDLRRLWEAAERIRRMSTIYKERLDGTR